VTTDNALVYADVLPDVLPFVVGCPDELAEYHIKCAAIELAKASSVLTYRKTYKIWDSVSSYFLTLPDGYEFGRIVSLCYGGYTTVNEPFDTCNSCGCGSYTFTVTAPNCLTISPTPAQDVEDGFTVAVAVYPTRDSASTDRDFLDRYRATIAAGALSRLFMLPKTEWYSGPLARDHARMFAAGKTQAKIDKMMNFSTGAITMKAKRWL
jgi:hypothetical protein